MDITAEIRKGIRYGIALVFIVFLAGAVIHLIKKPALPLVINPGDRYEIDGAPVSSPDDAEFVASWHHIGEDVRVTLIAEHRPQETTVVRLVPYYSLNEIILSIVTAVIMFIVGFGVFLFRPDQETTLVFYVCSAATSIGLLGVKTILLVSPLWIGLLLALIFFMAYGATSVTFLHFTLLFPLPYTRLNRRWLVSLYVVSGCLAVSHFLVYTAAGWGRSIHGFDAAQVISTFQNGFAFLLLVFGVGRILLSYREAKSTRDRQKIRLVIAGLIIGTAPFIFLWLLPQAVGLSPVIPEYLFKLFLLGIPCLFALSVLRYNVMDVDILIHRGAVYSLAIGFVLVIYSGLIGAAAFLIDTRVTSVSPVYFGIAAVLTGLIFQPLKNRAQHFVNRYFFHIEYNFREALRNLTTEIKECIDMKSISDCLVRGLDSLLVVDRIGVFILEQPSGYIRMYANHNFQLLEKRRVRFEIEHLKSTLMLPVGIERFIEPTVEFEIADSEVFNRWGMVLVFPIVTRQREILGFIVLGPKKSGLRFTEEDMDLLRSVGDQTSVAMERLLLQQKVILEHAEAERLGELNKMKSYFVSSVSHDMKTPLTSIRMFAELLQSKSRSPRERTEYLKIIEGESERLTRLINNVLDFSRIERGVKEYRFSRVNLNTIVAETLASIQYQLDAEKVDVRRNLTRKGLWINGDSDAITEAVINLVTNAVKYSHDVREVTIITAKKDAFALLTVADKGIGIEPDEVRNIFQPFYQTPQGRERGAGGVGLGLSIVKHIMDAHHGEIDLQSTPGEGTSVTLLFPLISEERTSP